MARHSRSDLGLVGTRLERASLPVIKLNELGQQLLPNTRDRHQIALCGELHQLYQAMHVFSNVFHASALIFSVTSTTACFDDSALSGESCQNTWS
jgi:hypothetical protein